MLKYKKKIVFTGGNGRFGKVFQKKANNTKKFIYFPSSKELDILDIKSVRSYLKLKKPKYLVHAAGLSRPMSLHDKNISKSIDLNIIGTANITKVCSELNPVQVLQKCDFWILLFLSNQFLYSLD